MTVAELILALQQLPQDAAVVLADSWGHVTEVEQAPAEIVSGWDADVAGEFANGNVVTIG